MISKPGRNDPCPCGSGRKFKKCCGSKESALRPPTSEFRTGTPLDAYFEILPAVAIYSEMIAKFEPDGRELRKRVSAFEKCFRPGEPGGILDSIFVSWQLFDLRFGPSRRTIIERFLADASVPRLREPAPTLLRRLGDSYLTFYEVLDAGPDPVILREVGTGAQWKVFHVCELSAIVPRSGEIWFARLIGPREEALSYTTPYIIDSRMLGRFRRTLDWMVEDFLAERESEGVPGDRVFAESQKAAAEVWVAALVEGQRQSLEGLPPALRPVIVNTDRDELVFTEIRFKILDETALRKKLARLKTFPYDEHDQSWNWLKTDRDAPGSGQTLLGHFRIEKGELRAETNSRERAARLERKLLGLFSGMLATQGMTFRRLEDIPPLAPEEREKLDREERELMARPEVRQALREQKELYYFEKFPRRKVPMLGNITPVQASRTKSGRRKLEALLDQFDEWQDQAGPDQVRVDFDVLRRKLGLTPRRN